MRTDQTHILGAKVDLMTAPERRQLFLQWTQSGRLHHVVTLNPEIALIAELDPSYRKLLNKSELTVVDGIGLQFGAFLLGTSIPRRCTGRKLLREMLKIADRQKKRVFLLGGEGQTARKASKQLQKEYPGLIIAGAQPGPQKEDFSLDTPKLIDDINASGAEILLVAFGAPKQEQWIHHNKQKLSNVKIAVGVGGIFDYLAKNVPVPPKWVSAIGMEWLFRLFTQPSRIKRILRAVFTFPGRCLVWRVRMHYKYRENVVGIIRNQSGEILLVSPFWSETTRWQFPQGGVDGGEGYHQAILREMSEELGSDKFRIADFREHIYAYVWPSWYRTLRGYRGQRQSAFLLDFYGENEDIDITREKELAEWTWCKPENLLETLAPPRREIGQVVLDAFHLLDEDREQ